MPKITKQELEGMRENISKEDNIIKVGMSTCGIAAGADTAYKILRQEISNRNLDIKVKKCGCTGKCYAEPLVEVVIEGMPTVTYGKVTKEVAENIIERHVVHKELLNNNIYDIKN